MTEKVYPAGRDVEVSIRYRDISGEEFEPSALDYTVYDGSGAEIVALTNIPTFDAEKGHVEIVVPAADNTLDSGVAVGARLVSLKMTTASGVVFSELLYLIESTSVLSFMENSFMTYPEAVIEARTIAELNGWVECDQAERSAALITAYTQIGNFMYEFEYVDETCEKKGSRDLDATDWANLNSKYQSDFRRAQIVQADYLLGGSTSIERKIQDGLQAETIGETSQFYRPRPSLTMAISRSALNLIGKYVVWNAVLGRA